MRPCSKCGMLHAGKCDAPLLDKRANKPVRPASNKPFMLDVRTNTALDVQPNSEVATLKARIAELEAEVASLTKPAFDKTAYMREYMRKARARVRKERTMAR